MPQAKKLKIDTSAPKKDVPEATKEKKLPAKVSTPADAPVPAKVPEATPEN